MKSYLYYMLLCSVLPINSCVCKAEEPLAIRHVFVELTAPAEIENLLKSAILRQLRQFTDVEVEPDEQSSEIILRFHVISTQLQNGTRTGYVISLVNTSRFQIEMIESLANTEPDNPTLKSIKDVIKRATVFEGCQLYTCGPNGLDSIARTIVAEIDAHILEPMRRSLRQTVNQYKADRQ